MLEPARPDLFHLALHAGRAAWHACADRRARPRAGWASSSATSSCPPSIVLAVDRRFSGGRSRRAWGSTPSRPSPTEPLNRFRRVFPPHLLAPALGLWGRAFTLDAACASSLYALKLAADELRTGRADAMLTGGLSRPDPLYTQMGFSQLRALSRDGQAHALRRAGRRPGRGRRARGCSCSSGSTTRFARAIPFYGVIAGIGLSNDVDGGLLAPSSEGQLRAMRARLRPGGLEARGRRPDRVPRHRHAGWRRRRVRQPAVPSGRAGRVAGMRDRLGQVERRPRADRGGAAGLLKVLLALKHETCLRPPFDRPAPRLELEASPFRILTARALGSPRPGPPRRAASAALGLAGSTPMP